LAVFGLELTPETVWSGLETLGFGANLQHYNPLVDPGLSKAFDVPTEWQLKAQLVFGSIESPASEKTFKPVEERVKIFGAK
jgi:predicted oxidoreductase (fatty acid repression mutant protein)